MNHCKQCQSPFEVTPEDLVFYDQISPVFGGKKCPIPPPTLCPDCRCQRRYAWRNERNLYRRKCDKTGKEIISILSPDKPYTVYDREIWWSDQWDPMDYGKEFDFSRPFFEQMDELLLAVPRMALLNANTVNSEYANLIADAKDCYWVSIAYYNCENTLYSYWILSAKDSMDLVNCQNSELCYECVKCEKIYRCLYCFRCRNSDHCLFSSQLQNCSNCLFCANLSDKKYHIFNKPYSKEGYERKLKEIQTSDHAKLQGYIKQYHELMSGQIVRNLHMISCEDSLGDDLIRCKNCDHCFDSRDLSDSKYFHGSGLGHHLYDGTGGNYEWAYETNNTGLGGSNYLFTSSVLGCSNIIYSECCYNNCGNCFGCVGLRHKQYCILNKQYTKEEYEALIPKIVEHMKKAQEWGEFFPATLSPYGYNETRANEYSPLDQSQALAKGFKWSDYEPPKLEAKRLIKAAQLPDDIKDIPDDISNWAVECEVTGKPFRIIQAELDFYRKMNLPIPHRHPDQRHKDRLAMLNPRHLWSRACAKCQKAIQTTYSPDRPEIVYCEECYLKTVY